MRIQRPKVASRVDRVAHPATSQFDIGNLKSAVPLDRRAEHRQPSLTGRLHFMGLERRLSSGHENEPVQLVLLVGVLCGHQVTKMYRIETPAEKSNFHWRATWSPAPPPARLNIELTWVWLAIRERSSQVHRRVARVAKWQTLLT